MPYRLTPRMIQAFREDLTRYHALFTGGRCQAWEQEELLTRAINSDHKTKHHARWTEGGHDDYADIEVRINGSTIGIQVKSGQVQPRNETLSLSGHRLTRFNGDFESISKYLNEKTVDIISIPYRKLDTQQGRQHEYTIRYIDIEKLTGVFPEQWEQHGSHYQQENYHGVLFKLVPRMSWQIWWKIPLIETEQAAQFVI